MLCRAISGKASIEIGEIDGSPLIPGITRILVNNGSVTDMGGGAVKVLIPANFDGGNFLDTYMATPADVDGGIFQ